MKALPICGYAPGAFIRVNTAYYMGCLDLAEGQRFIREN